MSGSFQVLLFSVFRGIVLLVFVNRKVCSSRRESKNAKGILSLSS